MRMLIIANVRTLVWGHHLQMLENLKKIDKISLKILILAPKNSKILSPSPKLSPTFSNPQARTRARNLSTPKPDLSKPEPDLGLGPRARARKKARATLL